jgi:hypothetical protein
MEKKEPFPLMNEGKGELRVAKPLCSQAFINFTYILDKIRKKVF